LKAQSKNQGLPVKNQIKMMMGIGTPISQRQPERIVTPVELMNSSTNKPRVAQKFRPCTGRRAFRSMGRNLRAVSHG
jgi:hypothetical protein